MATGKLGSERLTNMLLVVLVVCAVAMTTNNLSRSSAAKQPARLATPKEVKNWGEIASAGRSIGPDSAPVTVVEFGDFQCPACRKWMTEVFEPFREKYPGSIRLVFRHFPLAYHKAAYSAARAAECAAEQGRFDEMQKLFYEKQDSLLEKSYLSFGNEAGISDLKRFGVCVKSTTALAVVTRDSILGQSLKVDGTPTILVNGWRFPLAPDGSVLDSILHSVVPNRKE